MSGSPFQIPGLGQVASEDSLTPDLLAAAASIGAVDELGLGGSNTGAQGDAPADEVEMNLAATFQATPEQVAGQNVTEDTISQLAGHATTTETSSDAMEVDKPTTAVDQALQAQPTENKQELPAQQQQNPHDTSMAVDGAAPPSPHVAHALEAALDGLLGVPSGTVEISGGQDVTVTEAAPAAEAGGEGEAENPEWEVDSSPYESSSESSSDDSSDDDSDEGEGYQLLGIEETARMLMSEADGDGGGKGEKGADGFRIRTKNEVPEEVLPKPDIAITPDAKIESLGLVQWVVEKTAVIKSKIPGEEQVLDIGSVLCLENRTIIGVLAETLGNVKSPLYTVNFATETEIQELGLQNGTEVFYPVDHAKYVFTQTLKQEKGTDASNLHDEELAPDEMEFSDDEKEAEHKRQLKLKKRGNKVARGGRDQGSHPHPLSHSSLPGPPTGSGLNYDEDEDGPYKPLTRPAGFGQGLPPPLPSLPPKPEGGFGQSRGGHGSGYGHRGSARGGGRGEFRGRGGRGGHGRGGRGGDNRQYDRQHDRRQGGHGNYGGYGGPSSPPSNTYSAPQTQSQPQPPQNPHLPPPPYGANTPPIPPAPAAHWPAPPAGYAPPPPMPWAQGQTAQPQPPAAPSFNFNYQAWAQSQHNAYSYGQQPHAQPAAQPQAAPSYPPAQRPAAPSYPAAAPAWPGVPAPPAPAGAYINPAFFGALQQQHQQQQQQQQAPQAQAPPPQQHHQQQQQQQYWGQQQPHGGYGQAAPVVKDEAIDEEKPFNYGCGQVHVKEETQEKKPLASFPAYLGSPLRLTNKVKEEEDDRGSGINEVPRFDDIPGPGYPETLNYED